MDWDPLIGRNRSFVGTCERAIEGAVRAVQPAVGVHRSGHLVADRPDVGRVLVGDDVLPQARRRWVAGAQSAHALPRTRFTLTPAQRSRRFP